MDSSELLALEPKTYLEKSINSLVALNGGASSVYSGGTSSRTISGDALGVSSCRNVDRLERAYKELTFWTFGPLLQERTQIKRTVQIPTFKERREYVGIWEWKAVISLRRWPYYKVTKFLCFPFWKPE